MSKERFRPFAAVNGMLVRDGKIFLLRRFNTGWRDGSYTPPAGHIEEGESVIDAAVREIKEEANVDVAPEDLRVVHLMQRRYPGERTYFDVYVVADKWKGEPKNVEPHKADDGQWFSLEAPPENLLEYMKQAFEHYRRGSFFSEFGW